MYRLKCDSPDEKGWAALPYIKDHHKFSEIIHSLHSSDADQQDLDLQLTQVCCHKQIVNR